MDNEILKDINSATQLNWPLRFVSNIAFSQTGKLNDKNLLLPNSKQTQTSTGAAVMPCFIPNFVCLDFDFKDKELIDQIKSLLTFLYDDKDLFRRIGNREKLGQYWFVCDDEIKQDSIKEHLDIITTSKRCDAIGYWKGDKNFKYVWTNRSPVNSEPDELPSIDKSLIENIKSIILNHIGVEYEPTERIINGRHDYLKYEIHSKMFKGDSPKEIYYDITHTDQFAEIMHDRPDNALNEVKSMIQWSFNRFLESDEIESYAPSDNPFTEFTPTLQTHPRVKDGSILDLLYRAARRNQIKDAKWLAFFPQLAVVSWLLSFSTRYKGQAPNLMVLYVAKSGAGKSNNSKVIRELAALDNRLTTSIRESINSKAQLANCFSETPNNFFMVNEYSEILKMSQGTGGHMAAVPEKMMKLYSDYGDNHLHYEELKSEVYGVCYGPKMSALMFTSPTNFKIISESDFTGGIGRRTFTIIDDHTYYLKRGREASEEYFNESEKQKLTKFINDFIVPTQDDDDWTTAYDQIDITSFGLVKKIRSKNGEDTPIVHHNATKCRISNKIEMSDEASLYMQTGHIDKINERIKEASKTANDKKEVVISSFGEFTTKLAMIHALCGRKKPSKIIGMQDISWAENMVEFHLAQNLTVDLETRFDDSEQKAQKIVGHSAKFLEKLIEKDVKEFSRSDSTFRSFFQNKTKFRNDVLEILIANDEIKVMNDDASKGAKIYKVIKNANT